MRREYALAVGLCLAGAAVLLLSAGRPWAQAVVEVAPGLPRAEVELSGRELAPAVPAAGLVGLAGIAAVVATRGRARVAIGLLLAVAAGLAVGASVRAAAESVAAAAVADRALVPDGSDVVIDGSAWPWVAAGGAVILLAGGVLVAVRGAGWPGLSRRYAGPVAGRNAGPVPHKMRASGRSTAEKPAQRPHSASSATREARSERETEFWDAQDRGEDPTARE